MSFEKVNVNSLKQALQSCKNALKTSKIKELASDVASDNSWQTDSKNQLKQALNTLANTRYKELEKTLDKYIQAASKIDQYQDLERENKQLLQQNQSLNTKLYYTEYYKELEYVYVRYAFCSSFLRIVKIKDSKIRKELLEMTWNKVYTNFPDWKKNEILNKSKNKKNLYLKSINKTTYKIYATILSIIMKRK